MHLKLTKIDRGVECQTLINMDFIYEISPANGGSYLLMEGRVFMVKESPDEIYDMLYGPLLITEEILDD